MGGRRRSVAALTLAGSSAYADEPPEVFILSGQQATEDMPWVAADDADCSAADIRPDERCLRAPAGSQAGPCFGDSGSPGFNAPDDTGSSSAW